MRKDALRGRPFLVLHGDALKELSAMPSGWADCCVTSPPYYRLRDYGCDGQIGWESTPEEYVEKLVCVFRAVRRVLRSDGTLWVNIGDKYATRDEAAETGIAEGNLIGVPWLFAFAMRKDGWMLRQDIIWHKLNPVPESVRGRFVRSHEYLFLFSISRGYYFDADAVKEEARWERWADRLHPRRTPDWRDGCRPVPRRRCRGSVEGKGTAARCGACRTARLERSIMLHFRRRSPMSASAPGRGWAGR